MGVLKVLEKMNLIWSKNNMRTLPSIILYDSIGQPYREEFTLKKNELDLFNSFIKYEISNGYPILDKFNKSSIFKSFLKPLKIEENDYESLNNTQTYFLSQILHQEINHMENVFFKLIK